MGNILNVHPLVGESATVAAVSNALSSANLVHLATHAVFHPTSPLDSQVKRLTANSVCVICSASGVRREWSCCQPVKAAAGSPWQEMRSAGLATALLLAGVRSVVASLWPVDDAATAFHDGLL